MPKNTNEKKGLAASYVPFKSFKGFIERLANTTVPPTIDHSILSSMSGTSRAWLMASLRYLRLIDKAGNTQPSLKRLVEAHGTDEWGKALLEVLEQAYGDVVANVDLQSGTTKMLEDAFREYGNVDGQMLEKSVRFYLTAMKETGSSLSPHFKARSVRKPLKQRGKQKDRRQNEDDQDEDELPPGEGMVRFRLPIPGKGESVVFLPQEIDHDDWKMLKIQLDAYVNRLIGPKE